VPAVGAGRSTAQWCLATWPELSFDDGVLLALVCIEGAMTDRRHHLTTADLAAARRRDPATVARIYQAHANALFRFFVASTGDEQLAEDLTGSVFAAALEGLPTFRGPIEALPGWLFSIARHDLSDYRRAQRRSPIQPLDDQLEKLAATGHDQDPEAVALARLRHDDVLAACRQLSAEQREVLLLRMVGLGATEIAEVLGKTPGAVKALQRRGLAQLARLLGALAERKGVRNHDAAFGRIRR
jgi:RNA polymerase sigma-70 factor (ECF subfamily)